MANIDRNSATVERDRALLEHRANLAFMAGLPGKRRHGAHQGKYAKSFLLDVISRTFGFRETVKLSVTNIAAIGGSLKFERSVQADNKPVLRPCPS